MKAGEIINTIRQMIDSNNVDTTLFDQYFSMYKPQIVVPILIPKGERIIRVRINQDLKLFENIREFSYPPAEKSKLMRASLPGHPMFYGAIDSKTPHSNKASTRITTIFETSELLGSTNFSGCQIVTFSRWLLNDTIKAFSLPISENYDAYTYDAINIQNWWNNIFKHRADSTKCALSEYIGDLMAQKGRESIYKVTASFIYHILNDEDAYYQGVIYPTQKLNGEGTNIAITPQTVDNCCQLMCASTYLLVKQKENAELLKIADAQWDSNGKIKWLLKKVSINCLINIFPEIIEFLRKNDNYV